MKRLRDGEKEPSKERVVQTTIKIMVMGIFLCSTIIGTGATARAEHHRHYHHHLYWPGHYSRPYADTPGLTGLIHY